MTDFKSSKIEKPPRIMTYDIETTPLRSYHFGLGKQVLTHSNLDDTMSNYEIISISWMFDTDKEAKTMDWGEKGLGAQDMIRKFDKIIKSAQAAGIVIIGKNNKKFDNKHINTQRWLNPGLGSFPDWVHLTDDLETQLRKYFYFPSYSLDAISKLKGLGGKKKMEMQDWIDNVKYKQLQRAVIQIQNLKGSNKLSQRERSIIEYFLGDRYDEIVRKGKRALKKMRVYNKTDTEHTMSLILSVEPHVTFKTTAVPSYRGELKCQQQTCQSPNLYKNGKRPRNGVIYQRFGCKDCGRHAGYAQILANGKYGKMLVIRGN